MITSFQTFESKNISQRLIRGVGKNIGSAVDLYGKGLYLTDSEEVANFYGDQIQTFEIKGKIFDVTKDFTRGEIKQICQMIDVVSDTNAGSVFYQNIIDYNDGKIPIDTDVDYKSMVQALSSNYNLYTTLNKKGELTNSFNPDANIATVINKALSKLGYIGVKYSTSDIDDLEDNNLGNRNAYVIFDLDKAKHIKEHNIFESNENKRLFYHATKSEHLLDIVKSGLLPNMDRRTNWKGELGEWSKGKVFVTEDFKTARFYGCEMNVSDENHDPSCTKFIPILRIWINKDELTRDEETTCDWYSTKPIIGEFEIYLDGPWEKLDLKLAEEISQGKWDEYEENEGLISTVPTKKVFKILKRKFPDYYIGLVSAGEQGEIEISAGRKEYVTDIKEIERICRQTGWYISHGRKDGDVYKFDETFPEQPFDEVNIKQIFDTTKDIYNKPSIMYHVTPKRNVDKILKIGLVPKHKDKLVYHPDRIYLTDELELAWGLKKEFERIEKTECEILKVSTKDLDIKLYSDVDARQFGYYTMENIPPQFISILPESEYRKHWKGIQEETRFEKTEKQIKQYQFLKDLIIRKGRVTNWHQNDDFLDFCDNVQKKFYKIMKILVLDGIADEPMRIGLGRGSRYSELGARTQTSWNLSQTYKKKENENFVIKNIDFINNTQSIIVNKPEYIILKWDEWEKKIKENFNNSEIWYHGSDDKNLGEFDYKPIFFTKNKEYAKGYGRIVKPYYLDIKNPFDTRDEKALKIYQEEFIPWAQKYKYTKDDDRYKVEDYDKEGVSFLTADLLYTFLRKMKREGKDYGYDGVIVNENFSIQNGDNEYSIYPLSYTQIKEVKGVKEF
jgi:hypothetical protein